MATTTLTKITTRAKAIRKAHPSMAWISAVKKAGAEYRAGTIGKTRKKPAKKQHRAGAKKSVRKKRVGSGGHDTDTRTKATSDYSHRVNISLGAVNGHMKEAKKKLEQLIGMEEAKKFVAKGSRSKKKIQKKLNELKEKFRRVAC